MALIRLHIRKRPDGRVDAYHTSNGGGCCTASTSTNAVSGWYAQHAKLLADLTMDAGMATVMRMHEHDCDLDVDCTCLPD